MKMTQYYDMANKCVHAVMQSNDNKISQRMEAKVRRAVWDESPGLTWFFIYRRLCVEAEQVIRSYFVAGEDRYEQ